MLTAFGFKMIVVESRAGRGIKEYLNPDVGEPQQVSEALGQGERKVGHPLCLLHFPHKLATSLGGKVASSEVTFPLCLFPRAPSGIYLCRNSVQLAAYAETSLYPPCLQLACSGPFNPHSSPWDCQRVEVEQRVGRHSPCFLLWDCWG